ncbi:MAG: HAMP domain-containing histidine kinase [Ruminococcaceae bacterium]|nr:HAMP domain-containing histidine kinase [Oscillospiraceae bacterium]
MTDLKKPRVFRSSLKIGLFRTIVAGLFLAVIVYLLFSFTAEYLRTNFYTKEENRERREEQLIREFENYVADRNISSADKEKIAGWVGQKTYIYLLLYKGDDLYFSSGMYDNANIIPLFSNLMLGGSMDYPTEEEMLEYAKANDLVSIEMADGTVYASITEFSEYFYSDIARILSLAVAMLVLASVIMIYFFRVVKRITKLASDVTIVAEGDMNHTIHSDGNDEISKLSYDVENMRSAILSTLEGERAAREANTELITSMSHDIRTPLTVLMGYIDIMKMYSKDEVMNQYILSSEKTALRLKKLSDDMFKYLLVFGDSVRPSELEEYDGITLTEQLLTEHILLLRERGYDVKFTAPEDARVTVLTNAPDLMRIIDNLFSNIRKYADPSSPVEVKVVFGEDRAVMSFSNRIARRVNIAESTGIGLKTCAKIAELISCEFSYIKGEDSFSAEIRLISHKKLGKEE